MKNKEIGISFIGSGNVATHLATAFHKKGIAIRQVYSRNIENARKLAEKAHATAINDFSEIDATADLFVIAVKDDVIETVAKQLPENVAVVHTSGTVSLDILRNKGFKDIAVFYPFQTFSKQVAVDFDALPIFIESDEANFSAFLKNIAECITTKCYEITSKQRKQLHIVGVFANNFTNLMYAEAAELLKKVDLPFEVVLPLIEETAKKVSNLSPLEAQTGPAKRQDSKTIAAHLNSISNEELKNIYKLLSERIEKKFKKD